MFDFGQSAGGSNLHCQSAISFTALGRSNANCVKSEELFLWHGADPEHRDDSNRSAFDYARLRQPPAQAALEVLQRGRS